MSALKSITARLQASTKVTANRIEPEHLRVVQEAIKALGMKPSLFKTELMDRGGGPLVIEALGVPGYGFPLDKDSLTKLTRWASVHKDWTLGVAAAEAPQKLKLVFTADLPSEDDRDFVY